MKNTNKALSSSRVYLIDELRGFAIFCMVFYHAFFDMSSLFNLDIGDKLLNVFMPVEPVFAGLFVFISGISSRLSHNNLKRGLKLLAVSLLVTLATYIFDLLFDMNILIMFGILHMLAISMLAFSAFKPLLDKLKPLWGLIIFSLIFIISYFAMQNFSGQINPSHNLFAPLGFHNGSFRSSDYFPLIPWIFIFIAGSYLGIYIKEGKTPEWALKSRSTFFQFLGRNSLIIYILHQPVILLILQLISLIINR